MGWYAELLLKIALEFLQRKTSVRLNLKINLTTLHNPTRYRDVPIWTNCSILIKKCQNQSKSNWFWLFWWWIWKGITVQFQFRSIFSIFKSNINQKLVKIDIKSKLSFHWNLIFIVRFKLDSFWRSNSYRFNCLNSNHLLSKLSTIQFGRPNCLS